MRVSVRSVAFAAVALLGLLTGCATPQYQTDVSLIPPADAQGRACVQDCDVKKTACQTDCKNRYQACVEAIEPQVEAHYEAALKQYEFDLKQYAAALRHYEMELHFGWMSSYPYYYPYHPYYYPYWWDPWPGPYFPPSYPEPVMPTRDSVRTQLVKSNCQDDCGCLPAYDDCFVGCGGQILRKTVCIKNCPPEK
jgi:hypothetical protein